MIALSNYIKKVPIDRVIADTFELRQTGKRYMKGVVHDSLVIDLDKNKFYWNSIDLHGDVLTWLTKVLGLSYKEAIIKLSDYSNYPFERIIEDFETPVIIYDKLLTAFYNLGKSHRGYWYSRGFTDESIDTFKLGFTGREYVFPFITNSKLINFQCRTIVNGKKRVWRWASGAPLSLFGIDAIIGDELFFLEGPPDTVALHQIGYSGICNDGGLTTWKREWNKYIIKYNKIYVLYDDDSAGINGAMRISKKLLNRGYCIFWPTEYGSKFDVNKLLLLYGKELSYDIISILKREAISADVIKEIQKDNLLNEFITDYKKVLLGLLKKEFNDRIQSTRFFE